LLYAVIMAGGRGERFWPRSRMSRPKQFLTLIGKSTMIQQTVERVRDLVGYDHILVVTSAEFLDLVLEQVPQISRENILLEPVGRDTAAAVGLAAMEIKARDPEGVMIILPADHYIPQRDRFVTVLQGAVEASGEGDCLFTLGITPTRPETGYGYILRGELLGIFGELPAFRAIKFTEKPDFALANEFLNSGNYFWNSGMFIWKAHLILKEIERHIPDLHRGLHKIAGARGTGEYGEILREIYQSLPRISIDYGIMEKADNVAVIPGDFGWDDVGSWISLEGYMQRDDLGNAISGKGIFVDTKNSFIYAPGRTVAAIGVEDIIVVVDDETVLVCRKDRAQEIKKITTALHAAGYKDVL